eukprot:12430579-Karenia_brevis.AAC.1
MPQNGTSWGQIGQAWSQLVRETNEALLCTYKMDNLSLDRPFGGINVLFAGDFWQLDPPGGTSVASIPVSWIRRAKMYDPKPNTAHGEALFWADANREGAIQGVTELTENIRTEDPWLYEVQQEMRAGSLSEENWKFLHGRPTEVPGSWCNSTCACQNAKCQALRGRIL